MKKTLVFLMVMMMVGGMAFGISDDTGAQTISGTVALSCTATWANNAAIADMTETTNNQLVGEIVITSNDPTGVVVSHNAGATPTLVNADDGTKTITYEIYGVSGTGTTALGAIADDATDTDSDTIMDGYRQFVYVNLDAAGTYAGVYSDSVTFTVTTDN